MPATCSPTRATASPASPDCSAPAAPPSTSTCPSSPPNSHPSSPTPPLENSFPLPSKATADPGGLYVAAVRDEGEGVSKPRASLAELSSSQRELALEHYRVL